MKFQRVTLNLSNTKNLADLYKIFAATFKFPEYFGKNFDALVDCLFSIRFKEDEMTAISIEEDEFLLLELRKLSSAPAVVRETITSSIEMVNLKCSEKNKMPAIILLLNN